MRVLPQGPEAQTRSDIGNFDMQLSKVQEPVRPPVRAEPAAPEQANKYSHAATAPAGQATASPTKGPLRPGLLLQMRSLPSRQRGHRLERRRQMSEELYLEGEQCPGLPLAACQQTANGLIGMTGFSHSMDGRTRPCPRRSQGERRDGPFFEFQTNRLVLPINVASTYTAASYNLGNGTGTFPVYIDGWNASQIHFWGAQGPQGMPYALLFRLRQQRQRQLHQIRQQRLRVPGRVAVLHRGRSGRRCTSTRQLVADHLRGRQRQVRHPAACGVPPTAWDRRSRCGRPVQFLAATLGTPATKGDGPCEHATDADRRRSFTLIEMLVVIAIIAVLVSLTAVAVFRLIGTQQANNTKSELSRLEGELQKQYRAAADKFRDPKREPLPPPPGSPLTGRGLQLRPGDDGWQRPERGAGHLGEAASQADVPEQLQRVLNPTPMPAPAVLPEPAHPAGLQPTTRRRSRGNRPPVC